MRRLSKFAVIVSAMAASMLTGCAGPGYYHEDQVPPPGYGNPAYYPPAAAVYAQPSHNVPRYAYGHEPQGYERPYDAYQRQRYEQDRYARPAYPQRYSQRQQASSAGPIVGAIAGGLLGNTVGNGSGRVAATAVGSVVGYQSGRYVSDPCSPGVTAGGVVGAIAGGLLGNTVGNGNGRKAAAAAGAVVGYATGENMSRPARRPGC